MSIFLKKNPSNIEVLDIHKSLDGRKLLVNICVNEENLTLVNIYAPNKESNRVDFFKRLTTFINIHALSQSRLVLFGDFNCYINSKTDKSAKILRECINTLDIKDLWHTIHKKRDGFTWCDASDTPKSRIDLVLTSYDLLDNFKSLSVRKIPGTHNNGIRLSDHRVLKFELKLYDNLENELFDITRRRI